MTFDLQRKILGPRDPVSSASEAFDTSTPMGRAMLGMIATFAELEADLVSERTKAALAAVRARGTRLGAPSMVEVVRNGVRSVDPDRAATVARVRALYETGGFTHVTLAAHLNASGIPSVRGGRWPRAQWRRRCGWLGGGWPAWWIWRRSPQRGL
jgi:DNA invertase Pin-like site-specific DNA recombinase